LTIASGLADWASAGVATTASTAMAVRSLFMSLLLCGLDARSSAGLRFEEGAVAHTREIDIRFGGTTKITFRKLNSVLIDGSDKHAGYRFRNGQSRWHSSACFSVLFGERNAIRIFATQLRTDPHETAAIQRAWPNNAAFYAPR
jgi:hypothetical protein